MTEIEKTETTTVTEIETSPRTRKFLAATLVLIVAVIGIGFILSQMGLDKALLRQRIDEFSKAIAENGRTEGRDIRFSYKAIDITGGLMNRHAVIVGPELSISPLGSATKPATPKDKIILRSEQAAIYPEAIDLSKLKVSLDHPLDFFGGEDLNKKLLTITAATPFEVSVAQVKHDKIPYIELTHNLPSSIEMAYLREQQAAGAEEETPTIVPVYETMEITMAPGATVHTELSRDGSGLGKANVDINDISIMPKDNLKGEIRVATVTSRWEHTLNEKNHHLITVSTHIGDITAAPELIPYAPIALTVEGSYEGAAPQTTADIAAITAQESAFKLKKFQLDTKDSVLTATADFTAGSGDVLPVGMATITLTNVPFVLGELRNYTILNSDNQPMVDALVTLITGTPLEELKDATIDIKRARGGSFAIGKTTFEELFATVLKSSMTRRIEGPTTKPAAPVEKIQVEEGARG